MPRLLVLLLVCFSTSSGFAQEFKLRIFANFRGPFPVRPAPLVIGYDLAAQDTMFEGKNDQGKYKWKDDSTGTGEQEWPGFFDAEIFLYQPSAPAMFGKVSIMNKPMMDTFTKVYDVQASLGGDDTMMVLTWDRFSIPAIVKHITLTSTNDPTKILADLTQQSSVSFRKSEFKSRLQLKLYYNLDLPQGGVRAIPNESAKLLAYPNPAVAHSSIRLNLLESEFVTLQMFDLQGRMVMQQGFRGQQGLNEIAVDKNELGIAGGVYFVRATIGSGEDIVTKTLQLQLQ